MNSSSTTDGASGPLTARRGIFSVRGRIIGGFGLLVIILIVVAAGSAWQVRTHQSDLAAMEEHATTHILIQDAHLRSEVAAAAFQRYLAAGDEPQITGDEALLPEIRSNVAAGLEDLTQALAQTQKRGDREQIARLNEISAQAGSLGLAVEQAIALRQTGGVQAQVAALETMVLPFRQYRENLDEAAEAEFQKASDLRSRADAAGDLALWLLIISGAAGAVVGLAASILIARSIINPLSSLEETAIAVSEGDLSARAPACGPRELAHLGAVLNHMMSTVETHTEELRRANQELEERHRQLTDARTQAATDPLTELGNHRAFHKRIRDEIAGAEDTGVSVGLVLFDIDNFKGFNDSLGHLAGDEILRSLAVTLHGAIKREDAYRYGGDEFAVLLPATDLKGSTRAAERLRLAVEKMSTGNGQKLTVSLGVASFPDMAASAEELIYRADMAMYWAKSTGKNRVGDWDGLLSRRGEMPATQHLAHRDGKLRDAVVSLVSALAAKDPVTRDHTERCAWYSGELAKELGLDEQEMGIVRLGSGLHDIGKLGG